MFFTLIGGGILFYMISRGVIMIVCGKPQDVLSYTRHTLQQRLALLSTPALVFFKL